MNSWTENNNISVVHHNPIAFIGIKAVEAVENAKRIIKLANLEKRIAKLANLEKSFTGWCDG